MGKFYRCEYWISAAQNHIGCRYDIYLAWSDAQNYVKLQIHSGRSTCEMIECVNAVEQVLLSENWNKIMIIQFLIAFVWTEKR